MWRECQHVYYNFQRCHCDAKLKLKRNQCNDLIYIIVYSTIYNFQDKETRVEIVPYQDHLKLSVTRLYHKKGSDKERSTALPVYLRSLCC